MGSKPKVDWVDRGLCLLANLLIFAGVTLGGMVVLHYLLLILGVVFLWLNWMLGLIPTSQ